MKIVCVSHPIIGTCFLTVMRLRSSWLYRLLDEVGGVSGDSVSTCSELEERSSWDSVRGREEEEEEEDRRERVDGDSGTVRRFSGRLRRGRDVS